MTVSLTKTDAPAIVAEVSPEIAPADLVAALNAVIPHAGTDSTLPMLVALQFVTVDGYLTLAATDRYTIGTYRIEWKGEDIDVLLPLREAKELLRFAKGLDKRLPAFLTIEEGFLVLNQYGTRTSLPLDTDHQFVKWQAIMPSLETLRDSTMRIDTIGFNPAYLAKFAKAGERNEPMRLTLGASPIKPARVDIGESFTGLIMPVRLDS